MACAGEWVMMRVLLAKDPKVLAAARLLMRDERYVAWVRADGGVATRRLTVAATVAALLLLWGVARSQGREVGDDLVLDLAELDALDEIAELPGLGDALAAVGWAEALPLGGVRLPKFFRQNASTAKRDAKRAADRERLRLKRQAEREGKERAAGPVVAPVACDVAELSHATSPRQTRPEESRGEDSRGEEKTPLTPQGGGERVKPQKKADPEQTPGFAEFWDAYPRREGKQAAARAFAKLSPSPELLATITGAVERQKKRGCLEPRSVDGRSVIPHASTWLNGRRWLDEPPPDPTPFGAASPLTLEQEMERKRKLVAHLDRIPVNGARR